MSATDSFDEAAPAGEGAAVHVVKVGGKPYAVGLIWNDVEDKASATAEARKVAARPKIEADLFCLRAQGDQYGLGWKRHGHGKGMPSLAGQMADARTGGQTSWIGLFPVEGEGHYLIAVRDDLILGETDRLYADEMEARAAFDDLLGISDWGEVHAPEGFGFDHATPADLASAMRGAKAPRMQDLDRGGALLKWGGIALVLAGGVVGSMLYLDHLSTLEAERQLAAAQQAAEELLKSRGKGGPKVEVPPPPWDGRFAAAPYLKACGSALDKAVLTFPGWNAWKLECDGTGTNVKLTLERAGALGNGGGTINWIRATLDGSGLKATASPLGENGAVVTWSLEAPERYKVVQDPKPPTLPRSTAYLKSWFEEAFTVITVSDVKESQFFKTMKYRFESPYEPTRFSAILARVPGLTVDKVTVDLKRQPFLYTVEGLVVEQLPLPPGVVDPNSPGPAPATGAAAAAAAPTPRT